MKVAFCASEIFPFAKTGGLADVAGSLPLALKDIGVEVKVFMPYYKCVKKGDFKIEYENDLFATTRLNKKVSVYLIKNTEYFYREGIYGSTSSDYEDNLLRFKYFCLAVFDVLKITDFQPDIIHCHDWQTSLLPVYLKEKYNRDEFFQRTKSLLTIHNLAYQGVFPKEQFHQLDLDHRLYEVNIFEFYGQVNLLKAGMIHADAVNTVSPQYSKEIQTKELGCGLDGVLREQTKGISGILNGLDYSIWNPKDDPWLKEHYDVDSFDDGKAKNKRILMEKLGSADEKRLVLGFVGRLSHQKGVDLIIEAVEEMFKRNVVVVIQGVGGNGYESRLKALAQKYPQQVFVQSAFDESLAHQIYAGSDIFLMPSSFEPCGLSQMIALSYGAVPVVFHTGGLVDTIREYSTDHSGGNGFVFSHYQVKDFIGAIDRALVALKHSENRRQIITNAMRNEFSWKKSAEKYLELYTCLS